jgi:hypothetical protein
MEDACEGVGSGIVQAVAIGIQGSHRATRGHQSARRRQFGNSLSVHQVEGVDLVRVSAAIWLGAQSVPSEQSPGQLGVHVCERIQHSAASSRSSLYSRSLSSYWCCLDHDSAHTCCPALFGYLRISPSARSWTALHCDGSGLIQIRVQDLYHGPILTIRKLVRHRDTIPKSRIVVIRPQHE